MHSRFFHVIAYNKISFFLKAQCYIVCVCMYCIFFILSHVNWHLVFFHFIAIINNVTMNMLCKNLFKIFSNILSVYPEVGFLGQMVILVLTFWVALLLFYIGTIPFYISTTMYKNSNFFTSLLTQIILCFISFNSVFFK